MSARADLPSLRAALWTLRSLRRVRRDLARLGVERTRVSRPPPLPSSAGRGVVAILRRRPGTCLESALVLQRWEASHGREGAVIIGVRDPGGGFRAHAWLEGAPDALAGDYHELMRLPATSDR